MINEGLGKYLQTIWVTFYEFPHFYALASLRLRKNDNEKKKTKRKYCELQITTAYSEALPLKDNKYHVELWSQNGFKYRNLLPLNYKNLGNLV